MTKSTGSAAASLAGLRVLIVEDELLVAMAYEAILRRQGCTVIGPVPREANAMALLERERPDAVVLDLNLGGHRPTALAKAMVEQGLPFVIVSGYGEMTIHEPVLRGAPRLDKPLKPDELLDAIAGLARRSKLRPPARS